MRIVCLIKPKEPLFYFVNRIHREHRVSLAVIESVPERHTTFERIMKKGVAGTISTVQRRLRQRGAQDKISEDFKRFFEDDYHALDEEIPVLEVESVNDLSIQERLEAENPDLLLDHGTSIVRGHILNTAPLALNLHWGLSPYYRGVACTEWALLNWDPYNIGVTIHKLAREIDGGDIVAQKRATITAQDTVNSINMQLTFLGTELTLDIIEQLKEKEELAFHTQDFTGGFVTYTRQWSRHLAAQIALIEDNDIIGRMLKHPARNARLPIVELQD